jgi:hypothetical protein
VASLEGMWGILFYNLIASEIWPDTFNIKFNFPFDF